MPSTGPSTNAAVASASASIAVGAITVTLAAAGGDAPHARVEDVVPGAPSGAGRS